MANRAQDTRQARLRRPRVVYLDHCALESGGELALLRLLTALDQVDAHVILGEDGPLVRMLTKEGISTEVLPMRDAARNLRKDTIKTRNFPLVPAAEAGTYALRVARRLHQLKPDLVHTNSLKAAVYGGAAARLAHIPVVWHVRDRIEVDYLPNDAVVLIRTLARFLPSALIANSHSTLESIGMRGGLARIIYSPVIHDPVSTPDPVACRSTPHLRIAMVGRISPWKGQHVFINAFAQAFPEPGAAAVIVGGPIFGEHEYEGSLHQLARDLGLEDRVTFTGHVAQVAPILQGCNVAVHASTSPEPFGLVIVEAMAAGLAVVAADAGGPAEIITHGVDGLLFESGSAPPSPRRYGASTPTSTCDCASVPRRAGGPLISRPRSSPSRCWRSTRPSWPRRAGPGFGTSPSPAMGRTHLIWATAGHHRTRRPSRLVRTHLDALSSATGRRSAERWVPMPTCTVDRR